MGNSMKFIWYDLTHFLDVRKVFHRKYFHYIMKPFGDFGKLVYIGHI